MSLFRGSKNATIVNGEIVATAQDIADAVNDAIAAKNAAEAAEASALNTLDNFDDRYLGAKSSDPTVDNDGDALIDGALYYNTVNLITRVYDLSSDSWSDLKPSASDQANINALGPVASQVETVGDNISDVTTVASDLSGTDTIGTVAGSIGNVNATGTDIANVNTVAGELGAGQDVTVVAADLSGTDTVGTVAGSIGDVSTVATDLSGADTIGTVSTNIANVNTVAGIDSDVTTVSGISSDVTTVAADGVDIGTVANNIANVNTTATNISDVQIVAADLNETISEIEVVAGSITDVNSVGSNISDVTTVATNVSDVQTVAGISSDVTEVSGISSDVSAVSNISSDVTTVANNVSDVTNFSDVYIGPSFSEPTTRSDGSALQAGDLYFDTTLDALRAYDGSNWLSLSSRSDSEIKGLFSAGGDLTYDSATGIFSVTTYKSSDFDTDFSGKTTTDLTEGSNLYYTDARVNARIDSRVDKTFVDALNIDADTLDGQQGTHYLDRTNHTGTQTLSTISDSGALAALNTVDTAQIANQAVTDDKLATSLDLGSI